MRLLASVRSVNEVEAAVSGGADIIDAKEPSSGSLGAVAPEVFARIQARVPLDLELSAALGDAASPLEVRTSIAGLGVVPRSAPLYLKLGFFGVRSPQRLRALLEVASAAAAGDTVSFPACHRRGLRGPRECGLRRSRNCLGCRRGGGCSRGSDGHLVKGRPSLVRLDRARTGAKSGRSSPTRRSPHRIGRRVRAGAVTCRLPGGS